MLRFSWVSKLGSKNSQALALLCFNTSDHLSYDQLQERTQIPSAELQLTLQSLSLHKTVKFLLHLGGKLNQGKRVKSVRECGMLPCLLQPTPKKTEYNILDT